MNKIKSSILISSLILFTVNIHANQIKEEFKRYSNEFYNFSLFIPKKWEHTETKNESEFIITLKKDKYTSISLSVSGIAKNTDWLKYPYTRINKDSVKILESDLESFKNKMVGKILVFEYKHDKKNIIQRSYIIKYDKYMMLVECRSTIDLFFDYNDVFNKVMSSLKIFDSDFEVDLPSKIVYHQNLVSDIKITYNELKKNNHKTYKSKIEQDIEVEQAAKSYKYIAKHKKVEVFENKIKFDDKLNDILKKITLNFTVDKYGFFTNVTGYKSLKEKVKKVFPIHKAGNAFKQIDKYIILFINYRSLINTSKMINREILDRGNTFITIFTYQNPAGEKVKCYASGFVKDEIKVFGKKYIRIEYNYNTDLDELSKLLKIDRNEIIKTVGEIKNNIKDVKYYIKGKGIWIFDPKDVLVYSEKGSRKIKYVITKQDKKMKTYTHEYDIDEKYEITNISVKSDKKK